MAYTEVLSANSLTVQQFNADMFEQYLGQLWFKFLMGTSENSPIHIKDDLTKAKGDSVKFGIRSEVIGGKVVGNAKGKGNEGRMEFYPFFVTIDNVRWLIKFEDVPMANQRVEWDVLQQGRNGLAKKSKFGLEDDIVTALTDTSVGRVRGRYLYGAGDGNWNGTHTTALTNVDNAADQLSSRMLTIAKRKATIPVNAFTKLQPMQVMTGKSYEEWFCFVGHPYCLRDLTENDAAWRNSQLNLPPNSNRESVLYSGASFKGSWQGILVYEFDRMPLVQSTIQVGHCLLLGAQALAIAWGQRSKFGEDSEDVGHDKIYESHEIRGLKKIVWDRASVNAAISNEDNGQINVFAAAVADT